MIVTALCAQAKLDMMNGVHQPGDAYRLALFMEEADLGEDTKRYSPKGEVSGTGYKKGGFFLTNRRAMLVNKVACLTWNDIAEARCTFIGAAGALIYNESRSGAALATLLFDGVKSPSNGAFELEFPLPTPDSAVIVIL